MYTEYNSENVSRDFNDYSNSNGEDTKFNKFFGFLWKILLVIIIFVVLFLVLIHFGVISLNSSIVPDAVLLNQNEIGIKKGGTYQLVSTVLPENASNKQVIYSSSDPSVASVNEVSGYVKGVKEGSAVITVKTLINDKSSECIVNVGEKNILVSKIILNEKYINLAVGYTHNLTYRTTPNNATELNLKFSSSDTSVATVSEKGVVRGIKAGNAIITVSSSNGLVKDTTYVSVYKKGASTITNGESIKTDNYPKSINIKEDNLSLSVGTTSQLSLEVSPDNSNKNISWSSSNSNVATVSENGLITAKGVGTATIIAKTINNLMDTVNVTVGDYSLKLKSISLTTDYIVLPINSTKQFFVAFNPSTASNKTITWSSSDPSVASVNSSGYVKANKAGSAIITAKSQDGGYTDTAIVEVTDFSNLIEEKTISFASSTYSIGINQTVALNPIITPNNATFKTIEFTSSNSNVATVDQNGVVKGIKEGEVIITAITKRNRIKASVVVNVKNIPSTGVSLNNTNVSLNLNETFTLVPTVIPSNATNQSVVYKSDNTNIAIVDQNGIITAKGKGKTTITITPNGGGKASTCIVNVN